jgi:hypothetical protein
MARKDGRWGLPAKTRCAICGKPIGKASHSCPAPSFEPCHMLCVYPEMAVTTGEDE